MKISTQQIKEINKIIKDCGRIMLGETDLEHSANGISNKDGPANYVTVYDVEVQKKLIVGLSAIFPEAKFFAEEKDNNISDSITGLCFVIDPIDGTTNFIHNMGCSAISVGLFYNGEIVFGAVYDPYKKELFHAAKNGGAFLNEKKICVSDRDFSHALVSFGSSPYDREKYIEKSFDALKKIFLRCADIRRSGSAAIDICYVAAGRTDVFFEGVLSPWDFAAGMIILSEAGGKLTSFNDVAPAFGEKSSILCTNGKLHSSMLEIINS